MEHYVQVKMNSPEEYVKLPRVLQTNGSMEMGLMECIRPKALYNIGVDDVIKIARYSKVGHGKKYVQLKYKAPIDQSLQEAFASFTGVHFTYKRDHFEIFIPHEWIFHIGPRLQEHLAVPSNELVGHVVGATSKRHLMTKSRGEYVFTYSSIPRKHISRIKPGWYSQASEIRDLFGATGLKISTEGKLRTVGINKAYLSNTLSDKLRTIKQPTFMFIYSNYLENENVGEQSVCLLRSIPLKRSLKKPFRNVLYKKMRPMRELDRIHLRLEDEHGQLLTFTDTCTLILHIREVK